MITTLAPLGATHSITIILAYGEIPETGKDGVTPTLGGECIRQVTATVYLKPNKSGEPRTLQFAGPALDVEKEIAEKLPLAVQKISAHLATLDDLDAQLKAEQEKAQKEHEAKKTAANTTRSGVKSTTHPPKTATADKPKQSAEQIAAAAKSAARSSSAAKAADTKDKKRGSAAAALKDIAAVAAKAKAAATPATPLPDHTAELPLPEPATSPAPAEPTAAPEASTSVSLAALAEQYQQPVEL